MGAQPKGAAVNFILVTLILSSLTGQPLSFERGHSYPTAEACIEAQMAVPIQKAVNGKIGIPLCVREDMLHERST